MIYVLGTIPAPVITIPIAKLPTADDVWPPTLKLNPEIDTPVTVTVSTFEIKVPAGRLVPVIAIPLLNVPEVVLVGMNTFPCIKPVPVVLIVPKVTDVYVPVIANVICVVVHVNTTNVELIEFTVPLVCAGLNPASVIDAPTLNGATACVAYVTVAVPELTVIPVAVILSIDVATCGAYPTGTLVDVV